MSLPPRLPLGTRCKKEEFLPLLSPDSRYSLLGQGFLRLIADPSTTTDWCLVIRTSNTRPIKDKLVAELSTKHTNEADLEELPS